MAKKGVSLFGRKSVPLDVPCPSPKLMRALEPRILLDAAAVETAVDAVHEAVHEVLAQSYSDGPTAANTDAIAEGVLRLVQTDSEAIEPTPVSSLKEIAFIAPNVPDIDRLIRTLPANVEVVLLDPEIDGLIQIANYVENREGVDAIHLISHGEPGSLDLGSTELNSESAQHIYADQLRQIGQALTSDGDILIYGCDFGGGNIGRQALEILSGLTGADIAASTDLTGHADLGGDWDLEIASGAIEASRIDGGDDWHNILPKIFDPVGDETEIDSERYLIPGTDFGQEFTVPPSGSRTHYEVEHVTIVMISEGGGSSADIILTLRDVYDGTILGSQKIQTSDVGNTFDRVRFDFDNPTVLAYDQKYVLQINMDTGGPPIRVGFGDGRDSNLYAGHDFLDGSEAARLTNTDMQFELHGDVNVPAPANNPPQFNFPPAFPPNTHYVDVPENTTFVANVAATDADGHTLKYSITGGPSGALFTIDENTGDLSFLTPKDRENPEPSLVANLYSVSIRVDDQNGGTDDYSIVARVTDVDEAGDANDVSSFINEDSATQIPVGAFDIVDPEGDPFLTITFTNLNLNGGFLVYDNFTKIVTEGTTLTRNKLDDLVIVPAANATQNMTFTYAGDTGVGNGDSATFTIGVFNSDDAPVTQASSITLDENQVYNFLATDFKSTDVDGGGVTSITFQNLDLKGGVLFFNGQMQSVQEGQTYQIGDLADLQLVPAHNFNGSASFDYRVNNALTGENFETMDITVNPVVNPLIANPGSQTFTEDVADLILASTFDITDVDGDGVTSITLSDFSLNGGELWVTGAATALAEGDVVLAADIPNLQFVPAPNSTDPATFKYTANNSVNGVVSATITLAINPINDAPTVTDTAIPGTEDTATVIGNTNFGYNDIDGDTPDKVTFTNLNLDGGTLTYSGGTVSENDVIDFADLANLTFVPRPNSNTTASFTFTVSDGTVASNSGTMTLPVAAANDAPTVTDTAIPGTEDTATVIGNTNFGYNDIDGHAPDKVTFTNLNLDGGTLTYSGGTVSENDVIDFADLANLTFVPRTNSNATASFTFTVSDGTVASNSGTMTLPVAAANDAPVASPLSLAAQAGDTLDLSIIQAGFSDIDGDALASIVLTNLNLGDGTLRHSNTGLVLSEGMTITATQLASLEYVAGQSSVGTFGFNFAASDGVTLSAIMPVQFTVSAAPVVIVPVPTTPVATPAETTDAPAPISFEPVLDPDDDEEKEEKEIETVSTIAPVSPEPEIVKTKTPELPTPPAPAPVTALAAVAPAVPVPEAQAQAFVAPQPEQPEPEPEPIVAIDATPPVEDRIRRTEFQPELAFEHVDRVAFDRDLKKTGDEVRESEEYTITTVAKATFAFGSVLSVGSVAWLLRGGALAAALMTALPAWRRFDPISIVAGQHDETEDEEISDFDMMYEAVLDARARVKKESFL